MSKIKSEMQQFLLAVAMPVEEAAVSGVLTHCGGRANSTQTEWTFRLPGHNPFIVKLARVGQGIASAAGRIPYMLAAQPFDAAFFIGTAGGIKDVKLLDVVTASSVVYPGPEKHTPNGPLFDFSVLQCSPDLAHRSAALHAGEWSINLPPSIPERPVGEVVSGPILSSNVLFEDDASPVVMMARQAFRGLVAVEMEGYALLAAARDADVPVPALVVRGISDMMTDRSHVDNDRRQTVAVSFAAAHVFEIVRSLTVAEDLSEVVGRIAKRDVYRSEATLQADIRSFILSAGLNVSAEQIGAVESEVSMEAQVGDGSGDRIDIEVGSTVIEVKKNLNRGSVRTDAETQLGSYVARRVRQTGARFLGVLTDGENWHLYVPSTSGDGKVIEAGAPLKITSGVDANKLREWLGTILSTVADIRPTPEAIERNLGVNSPAHAADHATLRALFEKGRNKPEVMVKHELWGKLLRTAFGKGFRESEQLFIDHTLLVLTAEAIAHAVLDFDISLKGGLSARELADGHKFSRAQIHGVVEADFFDWPLELDGGEEFVRSLADRLSRFDWSLVDHDVLKHLYESVISQETREALGEYYTPDWLADRVVDHTLSNPLETRVMDVSAGSGTFIFHAVRAYLKAAEQAEVKPGAAVAGLVDHVFGMDIHPVAVTLARVTYLLAIGRQRLLAADRPEITIPVYLGDALQWEQDANLFSRENAITVSTAGDDLMSAGGGTLFSDDLVFPHSVLKDAQKFDLLVSAMAEKALDLSNTLDRNLIDKVLTLHKVSKEDWAVLRETFSTMRALHRTGRNHIWGYYVRNLIRPIWFSMPDNKMDLLIGNPPWLRYNKMTTAMQDRYKNLAGGRNLLSGALGASSRDLSTLFVVRAVELYLKDEGRFAYVMPHGTMTRKPNDGFRSGNWSANSRTRAFLAVSFEESWDLLGAPTGFPMTSCVVLGSLTPKRARSMPSDVLVWKGAFSNPSRSWQQVASKFTISKGSIVQLDSSNTAVTSPYNDRFRQGAILVPRMLLFAEETNAGPLGAGAGRIALKSRRSNLEKKPWIALESIVETVDKDFVYDVCLGETLAPYRLLGLLSAVLPIKNHDILLSDEAIAQQSGLTGWWDKAEKLWAHNRVESEKAPLSERMDYHNQLSSQLEDKSPYKVVYTSSGNSLAAAVVEDPNVIIDNSLYWAPVKSRAEGQYLAGILNSSTLLERVKPLQAVGLFGPRHFHKTVFVIPFGLFDRTNALHLQLVAAVTEAEKAASAVDVSSAKRFQDARKLIKQQLEHLGLTAKLEALVNQILPVVAPEDLEPI